MIEDKILALIEARGGQPFAAHEIGAEAGLCRQTVYRHIKRLRAKGHRIDGEAGFGFLARPVQKAERREEIPLVCVMA